MPEAIDEHIDKPVPDVTLFPYRDTLCGLYTREDGSESEIP